ncbi:MAG: glutathione peroxidase [Bacteroidia bacterium]|nr:glutathione peroxidase [Bacteroidia bacterium]
MNNTIYDYRVRDLSGNEVSLKDYEGKVILIVNTASECGFNNQFKELEELYQTYKNRSFIILAFPSNDFGEQEPLMGNNIQLFCTVKYKTTFPIFDKIKVKGRDANPLYYFLSNKACNGKIDIAPKWNFHKYLINAHGMVEDYFLPTTSPMNHRIRKEIEELLE